MRIRRFATLSRNARVLACVGARLYSPLLNFLSFIIMLFIRGLVVEEQKATAEARVLNRYPDICRAVVESPAFASWLGGLTSLEMDGETLYLRGSDMLRDDDQVIFEWAWQNGLLTDAAIAWALAAGDE